MDPALRDSLASRVRIAHDGDACEDCMRSLPLTLARYAVCDRCWAKTHAQPSPVVRPPTTLGFFRKRSRLGLCISCDDARVPRRTRCAKHLEDAARRDILAAKRIMRVAVEEEDDSRSDGVEEV